MRDYMDDLQTMLDELYKNAGKAEKKIAKEMRKYLIEARDVVAYFHAETEMSGEKMRGMLTQADFMRLNRLRSNLRALVALGLEPIVLQELEKMLAMTPRTRFELMLHELSSISTSIQIEVSEIIEESLVNSYQESHDRNLYMYDMMLAGVVVTLASNELAKATALKSFKGANYQERMIKNKEFATIKLREALNQNLNRNVGIRELTRSVFERFNVLYSENVRLLQTEIARVIGEGNTDAMEEAGLEKYEFLATLDTRTSKTCQRLDGKVFYLKDKERGVNASPMHPRCRSTEVPYFDDEDLTKRLRTGRNTVGVNTKYKATISYAKWKELNS